MSTIRLEESIGVEEEKEIRTDGNISEKPVAPELPEATVQREQPKAVDVPPNGGYGWSYGVFLAHYLTNNIFPGATSLEFWATVAPVGAEVIGLQLLPSALSLIWIALVLPSTFAEPIGLKLRTSTGDTYLHAQLFTGFMYIGAAICLWFLRAWKIREIARIEGEKVSAVDREREIRDEDVWRAERERIMRTTIANTRGARSPNISQAGRNGNTSLWSTNGNPKCQPLQPTRTRRVIILAEAVPVAEAVVIASVELAVVLPKRIPPPVLVVAAVAPDIDPVHVAPTAQQAIFRALSVVHTEPEEQQAPAHAALDVEQEP
ncbi:hypothetical protein B7494_g3739 [Chlorociboria aeruginascens]|nr:hypothetical protein B7494_g3739 [Chlorociboria aeruginascens]